MNCLLRQIVVCLVILGMPAAVPAQFDFEREPISYSESQPTNAITELETQLQSGQTKLQYDQTHGYLRSVLSALDIPISSQVLVFSKTSFQRHHISPQTPRALYFNDDVYVGWVQQGDVIEVSAADPQLGAVFYTIDQNPGQVVDIRRQTDHCLSCHASANTRRVPGHFVRSVYPDQKGLPLLRAGTFRTDHTSPFRERWGGWYVSGTHGRERHMGNVVAPSKDEPDQLDVELGANRTNLTGLVDTEPYLSSGSDLVALMVLEHQAAMHNRLTEASYAGRAARHDSEVMNRALERPAHFVSESTRRRYESAAERLLECLLMKDEYRLQDAVQGSGSFAEEFAGRGPRDSQGRSLRDLDLSTRLFRYPCSFLIYSEAFDALPDEVRREVYRQLWTVLNADDTDDEYAHLSLEDRAAIRAILKETKADLPAWWQG